MYRLVEKTQRLESHAANGVQYAYDQRGLLEMEPGNTITPFSNPEANPTNTPVTQNTPGSDNSDFGDDQNASPWQYNQDEATQTDNYASAPVEPVSWSASEFIDHEKNSSWYFGLAGLTTLTVGIIYLITRDKVTPVVIIIAAVLFGVTAKRKPRTLKYQVDNIGVIIDGKSFPYEVFKSFTVLAEGAFNSIQLMPLKRFMPPISLYFPPENENQIVTTLGSYLPHEDRNHDPIDRLMRRVRF